MVALMLAMAIWGSIGAVVLWSGLAALQAAFYRCLIGALCLIVYCVWRGDFGKGCLSARDFGLAAIGGLCIVANWVLLFLSFQYASITLGNVSYYLQPVFLIVLGLLLFREVVSRSQWVYVILTLVGVLLTVDFVSTDWHLHAKQSLGVLFAIMAGFLYAIATVIAKKCAAVSPSLLTCVQLVVGALCLFPIALHDHLSLAASSSVWGYVLILGIVHTALAYVLYYSAVKRVAVVSIAVLSYIDPVVAILTDIAFFHRHLHAMQWVGIVITMLASYWVVYPPRFTGRLSQRVQSG